MTAIWTNRKSTAAGSVCLCKLLTYLYMWFLINACVTTKWTHAKCCIGLELLKMGFKWLYFVYFLLSFSNEIIHHHMKSLKYHDTNNCEKGNCWHSLSVVACSAMKTTNYSQIQCQRPCGPSWWHIPISYMTMIIKMKAISLGEQPRIPNIFNRLSQGESCTHSTFFLFKLWDVQKFSMQ